MASTYSGKPICSQHRLGRFPSVACEHVPQIRLTDDSMNLSSFQRRSPSASSFYVSLLQVIDGVMPLALCPRVVPQCPQHFRSSETEATCDGCFFSGPSTLPCPGQHTHKTLQRLNKITLGFSFHFQLFIYLFSGLNL